MLTESRRRTSGTAGHVSAGDACVARYSWPGLVVWASKPPVAVSSGLGLKTRAEVPMPEGWHVAASGSSRGSEATGEKARWPSDHIYPMSNHIAFGDVVLLN